MPGQEQSQAWAGCTHQSLPPPRPPGPAGSSAERKQWAHLLWPNVSSSSWPPSSGIIAHTKMFQIWRHQFSHTPTWPLWWYTSGLRVSISAAMLKSCVESRGCCCCMYMLPRLIKALARSCINEMIVQRENLSDCRFSSLFDVFVYTCKSRAATISRIID